jgi:CHAD domain-containing protein
VDAADLAEGGLEFLGKVLRKQWKRYHKGLDRVQEDSSEKAIHDSRVETRRLWALIELLGGLLPARLLGRTQAALKQYLDTFDDLRDSQVQLRAVAELRRRFPAAKPFYAYLRKREARLAKRTRKQIKRFEPVALAKLIAGCRRQFLHRCEHLSATQAKARLLTSIHRAFRHTSRLRSAVDPDDTTTIHATRVAFKKFRYMVEALATNLPARLRARSPAMRRHQALMGDIQDAEVLLRTFEKFLRKSKGRRKSAGLLQRALLGRRQQLIRRYLAAANQLYQFWSLPGQALMSVRRRRRLPPRLPRLAEKRLRAA